MINIESIASQVKENCNISDAQYWGFYSPCGLLFRLRDMYKIENGLKPWQKVSQQTVLSWIDEREGVWEEVRDHDFRRIDINGGSYKPFDLKGINSELSKHGYFYGAGYGSMMKPVFILAEVSKRMVNGKYEINVLNREMARDLSTSPAMIQGHTIIARKETMRTFLWGKFEEMQSRKCQGSLHHAFSEYGLSCDSDSETIERDFPKIIEEELAVYVQHELGEASQRRVLGTWWKELLTKVPHSRAEMYIRALKDIMSDTCRTGMLTYIIDHKRTGSLSFYVSLLSGFRRTIFPEILTAYTAFRETNNWDLIEEARAQGYKTAGDSVRKLKGLFDKGAVSAKVIEREMKL